MTFNPLDLKIEAVGFVLAPDDPNHPKNLNKPTAPERPPLEPSTTTTPPEDK